MDQETAWQRRGDEWRRESRGVGGGNPKHRMQGRVGPPTRRLQLIVEFGAHVLGKGDGGNAMQGSFPGPGDCSARDDEAERGIQPDIDAA